MEFKKTGAEQTTVTRDVKDIVEKTGNIYQSLSILVKRSEQINERMKTELLSKLNEFATHSDELEEVFENTEQIEVSKFYERLPKPWAIAMKELLQDEIYSREIEKEDELTNIDASNKENAKE
tara:strand:+ start:1199 stop:1567 length:369 start_codon:yes stop_codon:yes gene_type:complete